MKTNNQEYIRQQYLREILGKDQKRKLSFSELVCCAALSIKLFITFITKRAFF